MAIYAVSMKLGVFSVFLLLLIPRGRCGSNSCDVDHCSHLLHAVYKDFLLKGTQRFCRNPTEVIKCVEDCFEIFFPDSFNTDYGTSIFNEMCQYDMKYDLNDHWDCISRHFHRLLSCVSISESMTTWNTTKDASRHLACKKVLKILDCPLKILHDCEEEAIEIVTRLFSLGLKPLMQSSCFQIPLDVVDLPVHYSLDNNYINIAACLDKEPNLASNCFKYYLQKAANYDLNNCSSADGKCVKLHGVTCSPLFPINDFYIPIFSFGQHICKEAPDDNNPQISHPLTSINNNPEKEPFTQDYVREKSTVHPTNTNHHELSSDGATRSDMPPSDQELLLSDSNTDTKELNLNVRTTFISSDSYHPSTSMSPFNNDREFLADNVSQHVIEKYSACGAMLHSSYLILWLLIAGHIFL